MYENFKQKKEIAIQKSGIWLVVFFVTHSLSCSTDDVSYITDLSYINPRNFEKVCFQGGWENYIVKECDEGQTNSGTPFYVYTVTDSETNNTAVTIVCLPSFRLPDYKTRSSNEICDVIKKTYCEKPTPTRFFLSKAAEFPPYEKDDLEQFVNSIKTSIRGFGNQNDTITIECRDSTLVGFVASSYLHAFINHRLPYKVLIDFIQCPQLWFSYYPSDTKLLLHTSCCYDHASGLLEFLLQQNRYTIDDRDTEGWTPLHYACNADNNDAIGILLSYGAQVNVLDNNGCTPLAMAIRRRIRCWSQDNALNETFDININVDLIALLLECGASEYDYGSSDNLFPNEKRSPLAKLLSYVPYNEASEDNRIKCCKIMVEYNRHRYPDRPVPSTMLLLLFKYQSYTTPILEYLCGQGANPDIQDQYTGNTALHYACLKLSVDSIPLSLQAVKDVIEILLVRLGANPTIKNNDEKTFIDMYSEFCRQFIIRHRLTNGLYGLLQQQKEIIYNKITSIDSILQWLPQEDDVIKIRHFLGLVKESELSEAELLELLGDRGDQFPMSAWLNDLRQNNSKFQSMDSILQDLAQKSDISASELLGDRGNKFSLLELLKSAGLCTDITNH